MRNLNFKGVEFDTFSKEFGLKLHPSYSNGTIKRRK